MKSQDICSEEQVAKIKGMLLSNMLEYLDIPFEQYVRNTSDSDRENHIKKCKHCSCLRECVHMLLGDSIDPASFCANYPDFKHLM